MANYGPANKDNEQQNRNSFLGLAGVDAKGYRMYVRHPQRAMVNPKDRHTTVRRRFGRQDFLTCCALHNWLLETDNMLCFAQLASRNRWIHQ